METSTRRGEKRKWATKTRNGCLTCKKSHVKCDESKPVCRRCIRLNLVCGGYRDLAEVKPTSNVVSRQQRRLLARENADTIFSGTGSQSSTPCDQQTNLTPSSIAVWLSVARTPYERDEERKGLQIWLEIMRHMGRSDVGLKCWTVLMPMLAWSYDGVRHVQTAAALVLDSHRRRDDSLTYKSVELTSLRHAKMAVDATLNDDLPVEARVMILITLWMFEIVLGRCLPATSYASAACRLASQADLRNCSEPLIAKYVSSFVGELQHLFNEAALAELSRSAQEDFVKRRVEYSHDIMLHAKYNIQSLKHKLNTESDTKTRSQYAYELLDSSERGLADVLRGWHHPTRFPDIDTGRTPFYAQIIENYSPFECILQYFDKYLEEDDEKYLTMFHLQFRPCLDYFMWMAAGNELEARQAVMSLWNVKWAISPRASAIAIE